MIPPLMRKQREKTKKENKERKQREKTKRENTSFKYFDNLEKKLLCSHF
jgi:hypothetical protein